VQQPRPKKRQAARLGHQPKPAMAGREGLRVAEADRPAAASQAARPGECVLAVCLKLCRAQPDTAALSDRTTTIDKVHGTVH